MDFLYNLEAIDSPEVAFLSFFPLTLIVSLLRRGFVNSNKGF